MTRYIVNETGENLFGIVLEDESGQVLDKIEDITDERDFLERVVETFNQRGLMPECFRETIGSLIGILL